ncbi:aldo-keto reductase family 1 member C15-like isoform X2 [Pecten maximus]|uniref:aldo-keto reductase family 1 member C15-like isoform X2 n=1 Tax=Pecten maximus TaxID=6579 RepID=UPI001458437F|nr:aldo-keto reductase family 1 member C15-like isoform X2 [Pecten maximus]
MEMAGFITLNNGRRIPQVALGTSRISSEKLEVTIKRALDMGYRHIDTAFLYGNEAAIGKALHEHMASTNLSRQEIFVTTKLFPTYMKGSAVGLALDESLRRLRLDYVDLFLIHLPCAMKEIETYPSKPTQPTEMMSVDLRETWKAMEETVYKGKVRSIGVSSFNSKQLAYICETARIQPAINQVEAHARLPQKNLHEFCKSRNILLEAFCPLGSPFFIGPTERNTVQSRDNLVENPIIMDIAENYKRTAGQILLRNLVQRGIAVIPKSENPKRMKENLQIFDFSLSETDMNKIDELNNGERRFILTWYKDHPEYPFHEDF